MQTRDERPAVGDSGWAPLRFAAFRTLWLSQFTSNVGGWMQTVAAQWVMISLTSSAVLIGAIQTASSLPVLLLAVPAGVLGDLVDRRRLILAAQAFMLAASTLLAVLAAAGWLTPWALLGLLFLVGVGGAASAPVWQTLQPELVPPQDRAQAIALGSVNQNLARAVGPALGGALLAATSASVVFGVNAASFVAVLAAVFVTAIPPRPTPSGAPLPREHALAAARAGGRFVRNSPTLLALIARGGVFVFFSGAIWALLPIVAHGALGLGSAGYGGLLGCVGAGALATATFGPAVKRRLPPRAVYATACLTIAAAAVALGFTHVVWVAVVALVAAGAAWILGIGLLGAAYQGEMPAWVKSRGISYYLIAFQGSIGIGALALGTVANAASVRTAFLVVAAGLVLAVVLTWRLALPASPPSAAPGEPLPLPAIALPPQEGPVRVTVDYRLADGNADAFVALLGDLRRLRRRTGAIGWCAYRDAADPRLFTETFLAGSWEEHERQHARLQPADVQVLAALDALLAPGHPRVAHHAFAVRP